MMEIGLPDQKRPRLVGPPPAQWQNSPETSRQLPPPPYPQQHHSPFSRPEHHPLDRRHSGHTEHPPHQPHPPYDQDPRRPNSGPSHGYHTGPPPPPPFSGQREPSLQREPMVKRDPSDEPPQHYRPSSTGAGPDHNVIQAPHHDGGRYQLPPFEQPPHPGPPPYRNNSYQPPQSPMASGEQYHNAYGPPGLPPSREQYASVSYPTPNLNNANAKRKATRAAQACDSCRTLKAKCDEGRPSCLSCKEKGIECRYRDPPPKQQDKASADMMESLMRIENAVAGLTDLKSYVAEVVKAEFSHTNVELQRMDKIQKRILDVLPNVNLSGMKEEEPRETSSMPVVEYARPSVHSDSQALHSNESPYSSTPGQPRLPEGMDHLLQRDDNPDYNLPVAEDSGEEEGGDPGPPKPSSIPVNHTTGAARLLGVPQIAEMCKMGISKMKNPKFPIVQEEKRGLIRLFGRGEGIDAPPGYDKESLVDHGPDSTPGDTHSDASSPAPSGEEWGQMGGLTPPGNPPADFIRGGIHEGMPDLSRETVLDLVKSYKENMNNMHPILIPSRLDMMVDRFLRSIPESQAKPRQVSSLAGHGLVAGFVGGGGGHRNPESPGNKRKRSPASGDYQDIPNTWDYHKPGHPFRTITSALVFLVMALGKICQHKTKLPDVVPDKETESTSVQSPNIQNGHPPSPLQNSPSLSTPMALPSPMDKDSQPRSRRTSIEGAYPRGGAASRPKNLDVIPGLAYFAFATDVIGNQLGGNSLQHVHANILAGLYQGQLARVMESHSYINQACRALQVILRPKLDRFKKIKKDNDVVPSKDNPLIFAFWTCLQLESDIIAELPCPHSGILTYEDDMPGPNLQAAYHEDGFDPMIIESYSAQLFLRKHLNQLHNMFYRPENDSEFPSIFTKGPGHFPTIEAAQESLHGIHIYAPNMQWKENDPPATDILSARLRGKYYGAQVITYRHFVLKILEQSAERGSKDEEQVSGHFKTEIDVPSISKGATRAEEIDPKILEYARKCINALIKSTTAFHGLGDPGKQRLLVTNVWGTAHAQWGNMLVLQAAYMDPILKQFVDERTLKELLEKTLSFLSLASTATSALHSDWRILRHCGDYTGLRPLGLQGPNTNSSFSSNNTGDIHMGGH